MIAKAPVPPLGSLPRCYHIGVNDRADRRHTIPYKGFVWEFIRLAV